jgi:hypothetical protein
VLCPLDRTEKIKAPYAEAVVDAPARPFFSNGKFPVKLQEIPCSEGISAGSGCYSLHFRTRIEVDQWVDPDLFPRPARARGKGN